MGLSRQASSGVRSNVAPHPGHTALVLAAGVGNGAVIETDEYGTVAICGKTAHVENISHVDIEVEVILTQSLEKENTIDLVAPH